MHVFIFVVEYTHTLLKKNIAMINQTNAEVCQTDRIVKQTSVVDAQINC